MQLDVLLVTAIFPVMAGHLTEALSEVLQKFWTWLDRRGKLVKRIVVVLVGVGLTVLLSLALGLLRKVGVPDSALADWINAIAAVLLAFWFHSTKPTSVVSPPPRVP